MKWRRHAEIVLAFGVPTLGLLVYILALVPRLLDDRYYVAVRIPLWVAAFVLAGIAAAATFWWRDRRGKQR